MTDKIQHEKDYNQKLCIDCPYCSQDRPSHSCRNCYSEIDQKTCWDNNGYCSQKCLKYVTEEIPKIRGQKKQAGIKCECDELQCFRCLSINCKDINCPTHPRDAKIAWRKRWEASHKTHFPHPENY